MKKYIIYAVVCLLFVAMFVSCTAEELEPSVNTIENTNANYIGIDPIRPNLP